MKKNQLINIIRESIKKSINNYRLFENTMNEVMDIIDSEIMLTEGEEYFGPSKILSGYINSSKPIDDWSILSKEVQEINNNTPKDQDPVYPEKLTTKIIMGINLFIVSMIHRRRSLWMKYSLPFDDVYSTIVRNIIFNGLKNYDESKVNSTRKGLFTHLGYYIDAVCLNPSQYFKHEVDKLEKKPKINIDDDNSDKPKAVFDLSSLNKKPKKKDKEDRPKMVPLSRMVSLDAPIKSDSEGVSTLEDLIAGENNVQTEVIKTKLEKLKSMVEYYMDKSKNQKDMETLKIFMKIDPRWEQCVDKGYKGKVTRKKIAELLSDGRKSVLSIQAIRNRLKKSLMELLNSMKNDGVLEDFNKYLQDDNYDGYTFPRFLNQIKKQKNKK